MLRACSKSVVCRGVARYSAGIKVMRPVAVMQRWQSQSPAVHETLESRIHSEIETMRSEGTYKKERVITSPQSASIHVQGRTDSVLNFCGNQYLGLSNHPTLCKAAKDAIDTHGFGLSSVRFICGTQDLHKDLESAIAKFHKTEDTILYPSCFDANAGLFEAILTKEDAIISDQLNHASIIDGVRLCKAQRKRFAHLDMVDLEKCLQETQDCRVRLIATDGVFSMDGDVAPLKDIVGLARKYDARVFIDECHATGFFGPTGRGTDEYFGLQGQIDIINSTLGKALGGATGGYTTGKAELVDLLRNKARPYLFSNTLAPAVAGASIKVFEMLEEDTSMVQTLLNHTHYFRDRMEAAGFTVLGARDHPICPVLLKDAKLAGDFADRMLEKGIYVIGFSFPVVPKGQARIRTQLSAAHTQEQLEQCVDAFVSVGKEMGVVE